MSSGTDTNPFTVFVLLPMYHVASHIRGVFAHLVAKCFTKTRLKETAKSKKPKKDVFRHVNADSLDCVVRVRPNLAVLWSVAGVFPERSQRSRKTSRNASGFPWRGFFAACTARWKTSVPGAVCPGKYSGVLLRFRHCLDMWFLLRFSLWCPGRFLPYPVGQKRNVRVRCVAKLNDRGCRLLEEQTGPDSPIRRSAGEW